MFKNINGKLKLVLYTLKKFKKDCNHLSKNRATVNLNYKYKIYFKLYDIYHINIIRHKFSC